VNQDRIRIRAASSLAAAVALAAALAAGTVAAEPAFGGYSCTADRAVGLQGDIETDRRYAGRIELRAAEKRFGVTLGRTEVGQGRRCKPRRAGDPDTPPGDEYSLWWFCKATTELTFTGGKHESELRGDDTNIFRDRLSGWFHLADDLRYVFAYTDFGGNFFLEEGRCEPD
jgi:hypothetical protein